MDNHEEPFFLGVEITYEMDVLLCARYICTVTGRTCLIGLHPRILFLAWRLSQKVSRRLPSFSICNTKQNWLFDHVNVFYIPDSSVNVINWDSSNIHKCAKLTPQGFALSFLIGLGKIRDWQYRYMQRVGTFFISCHLDQDEATFQIIDPFYLTC